MKNDSLSETHRRAYWRKNLIFVAALLTVWFIVSFVVSIIFVDDLNEIRMGGFRLGFWMAQQGSLYIFVILIFVAGLAALAIMNAANPDFGVEIEIYKNIKPGSGVGSSSASASGVVWAINELLGKPFNKQELTAFGMKGEAVASGAEHADNVAPGIFGGFTLVKQLNPLSNIIQNLVILLK